MEFIKYLSASHLRQMNIAIYKSGSEIKARVENIVNSKSVGARDFDSLDHLNSWFESLPGSGLGRIANAMDEIAPTKKRKL
ncbi:hypothetical protein YO5_18187 [Stutzerimonas stutzeri TS44]|nr:hypothetical protein YO5_18187 [Stutzerimonas stutzeri TS44]